MNFSLQLAVLKDYDTNSSEVIKRQCDVENDMRSRV